MNPNRIHNTEFVLTQMSSVRFHRTRIRMASIGSHAEYQEHRNPAKVDESNVCRLLRALEVGPRPLKTL